jgi:hypothetical protein
MKKIGILSIMLINIFNSCFANEVDSLFVFNRINDYPVNRIISFYGLETGDIQLGIVTNNKIRFFYLWHGGNNWNEDTDKAFYLPSNSRDVFSTGAGLGIVTDTDVIFFNLADSIWHNRPELTFILPDNCQSVFSINSNHLVGIVVDYKIKIYSYNFEDGKWEELLGYELELPINCQGIFVDEWSGIFVITENKIKYFSREQTETWLEIIELELDLPDNFRGAVFQRYLGIADDNEIIFFISDFPKGWIRIHNMDFIFSIIK